MANNPLPVVVGPQTRPTEESWSLLQPTATGSRERGGAHASVCSGVWFQSAVPVGESPLLSPTQMRVHARTSNTSER